MRSSCRPSAVRKRVAVALSLLLLPFRFLYHLVDQTVTTVGRLIEDVAFQVLTSVNLVGFNMCTSASSRPGALTACLYISSRVRSSTGIIARSFSRSATTFDSIIEASSSTRRSRETTLSGSIELAIR